MKNKHVPAGFSDKPCLDHQKVDGKKTGFRCTKIEGHKKTDKDPFGHVHAAIGVGTVYSDNRIDIAGMSEKNAMDFMSRLPDGGNGVLAAWTDKRKAA